MKKLFPPTTKRVFLNSNPNSNSKIRNHTIRHINIYKNSSDKILSDNIDKFNREWDTERFLETSAATVVIASSILGLKYSKYWYLLTGAVGLSLLQHSLQGWCPPVPIIRRMGVRTAEEINNEKIVFKMLRKDFQNVKLEVEEMLSIAER